jgi:magnesium transporter
MKAVTRVSEDLLRLVHEGEFFWLDLVGPTQKQIDRLVELIGLDHAAAGRALRFGEHPQLRRFRDQIGLVFFGAEVPSRGPAALIEVHVYVSGNWIVTVRNRACRALEELRAELHAAPAPTEEVVVARVLATLADTFDDLMDPVDDAIAELERRVEDERTSAPVRTLRADILRRRGRLFRARRMVRRQRDYIERAETEITQLHGLEHGQRHDLRDVSGQMIRVSDRIDDALDRLAATLDLLNSTVANRLNAIMERLTVVATIFLPLTVVTSFFGQNFGWMVNRIDSLAAFIVLGVGVFVLSGVATWMWVRSRLEAQSAD